MFYFVFCRHLFCSTLHVLSPLILNINMRWVLLPSSAYEWENKGFKASGNSTKIWIQAVCLQYTILPPSNSTRSLIIKCLCAWWKQQILSEFREGRDKCRLERRGSLQQAASSLLMGLWLGIVFRHHIKFLWQFHLPPTILILQSELIKCKVNSRTMCSWSAASSSFRFSMFLIIKSSPELLRTEWRQLEISRELLPLRPVQ